MDLARGGGLEKAADAALAVGLAGAVGAAVTGLNDWQHTDHAARRVGVAHGLLNLTAAVLQGGSLALRRAGFRRAGRGITIAGYGVALSAAYLGGYLVFEERIGVDHTSGEQGPRDFVPALGAGDLEEGALRRVVGEKMPVLLSRLGGRVYAIAETCSHLGGPLAEGTRDGASVICPWHGSRFDLRTGGVLDATELAGDELRQVTVNGVQVLLARSHSGEVCALANTCTHLGGPLAEGSRDGDTVICPWHGSRFDLRTGAVTRGPAVFVQPRFDARERDGKIEIGLPDAAGAELPELATFRGVPGSG